MQKEVFLTKNAIIYIFAPAGIITGGVELLHQLCDVLNSSGKKSYIVYYGAKPHVIPSDYKKYNLKVIEDDKISDIADNIIIVPETNLKLLNIYKNIKAIVWWMSVDNYYAAMQANCIDSFLYELHFSFKAGILSFFKKIFFIKKIPTYSLKKIRENNQIIYNAYQSEYAKFFLNKHGIKNIVPLSDYINDDYVFNSKVLSNKKNIIIYNPKKGLKFTKCLIKAASDLDWIPIQNMTRSDVKEIMLKAKVYIDFGHFPGKDRMPREAAMCGCCVITGKLGASGFEEDLPIDPDKYKFGRNKKNIPKIINCIRMILDNYEKEINNFVKYRNVIASEKEKFYTDVNMLFGDTNL